MALIAKEKGGVTMELIPAGVHLARCVAIIDLWTQKRTFKDQEKEIHEVRFEFELPTETYTYKDKDTEEEKTGTRIIGNNYTISLSAKANMRKFLESWRGLKFTKEELVGFDLQKILGKTCQLQIIHSEDWKYANIQNALPLMKGVEVPKSDRDLISFSIEEDDKGNATGYDENVFNNLPEWLQDKIMDSKEMKKLFNVAGLDEQEEDIKKEIKEKKETETKESVEEIEKEDVGEVFNWEPETQTKAREKSKAKVEDEDDWE